MGIADPSLVVVGGAVGLAITYIAYRRRVQARPPLPPGPPGLPIAGNINDIPTEKEWVTYTQWREVYGDIIHLQVFSTSIIILNSVQNAIALLERRSAKYSDRPHLTMSLELAGFDWGFPGMPINEKWKARRQLFDNHFRANALPKYAHVQLKRTRLFLLHLLETPEEFFEHCKYLAGSPLLEMVYGYDMKPLGDPFVALADINTDNFAQSLRPGAWAVDALPFLKHLPDWFPGAGFKNIAKSWKETTLAMKGRPFGTVKEARARGENKACIVSDLLDEIDAGEKHDEVVIEDTAGAAYAAGSDASAATLKLFIMQMVSKPQVQRMAQEELDRVCPEQLPELSDRSLLPYIEAIVMEVCRWHPPVPECIPHQVRVDDIFEGYFIPKGSIVVPNIWGMCRDPRVYEAPNTFNPSRFMKDGKIDPSVRDPRTMFFGFGKRQCPGRPFSENGLFLAFASVLKVFDILPWINEKGEEVFPAETYTSGVTSHAVPFKCIIRPRSPDLAELVRLAVSRQ